MNIHNDIGQAEEDVSQARILRVSEFLTGIESCVLRHFGSNCRHTYIVLSKQQFLF